MFYILLLMLDVSWFMQLCFKGSLAGEMGWANYIASFFIFMLAIIDYVEIFWSDMQISLNKHQKAAFTVSTGVLIEQIITCCIYVYKLIVKGQGLF